MPITVKLKKRENIDKALKRLKRIMDKEGIMRELKDRRFFEKPSERKRRKRAAARIRAKREQNSR